MNIQNTNTESVKCERCGFSDTRAIHTHHVLDNTGRRTGAIMYLCANCHYILHAEKHVGSVESELTSLEKEALRRYEDQICSAIIAIDLLSQGFKELGGEVSLDLHSINPYRDQLIKSVDVKQYRTFLKKHGYHRALSLIIEFLTREGVIVTGYIRCENCYYWSSSSKQISSSESKS